jgi:hypothetical protein
LGPTWLTVRETSPAIIRRSAEVHSTTLPASASI